VSVTGFGLILVALTWLAVSASIQTPQGKPFVVELDIPAPVDSAGGIIVADIDNDDRMDFLVTVPGHVAAYGNNGRKRWVKKAPIGVGGQSETYGLPGHHGPGVAAGCGRLRQVRGRVLDGGFRPPRRGRRHGRGEGHGTRAHPRWRQALGGRHGGRLPRYRR